MRKINIIGTGNMGGAIAKALEANYSVAVYDTDRAKALELARDTNIEVLDSIKDIAGEIALIAVKPQVLRRIYSELKELKASLIISIAAGVTLSELKANLGDRPIVRYMPNVAALCKKAVTAIAYNEYTTEADKNDALSIASSFGSAYPLPENLFSAFIGISGSGIAYAFEVLNGLALGGVREGIPYNEALSIASATLLSAAELQRSTGLTAGELESRVISAAGTTIEGVRELKKGHLEYTLMEAVHAAALRNSELENR